MYLKGFVKQVIWFVDLDSPRISFSKPRPCHIEFRVSVESEQKRGSDPSLMTVSFAYLINNENIIRNPRMSGIMLWSQLLLLNER